MSDDDLHHEETLTDNLVIVKKRSIGKQYIYHSHYSDQTMAHNLIIHSDGFLDHNWRGSLQSSSITEATHWYRCSVRIRCPKKIQLRINTITDVHSIFVSEESHDHTPSSEPS